MENMLIVLDNIKNLTFINLGIELDPLKAKQTLLLKKNQNLINLI